MLSLLSCLWKNELSFCNPGWLHSVVNPSSSLSLFLSLSLSLSLSLTHTHTHTHTHAHTLASWEYGCKYSIDTVRNVTVLTYSHTDATAENISAGLVYLGCKTMSMCHIAFLPLWLIWGQNLKLLSPNLQLKSKVYIHLAESAKC